MHEKWKEIPQYPPYQASNLGNIKGKYGKIMKQETMRNGYKCLHISINKKQIHALVHRLVAQAWLPNPNNKSEVDHIDGNRTNNCVENLRWVERIENRNNPITKYRQQNTDFDKLVKIKREQINKLQEEINEILELKAQYCI